jgi:hypothetical protein
MTSHAPMWQRCGGLRLLVLRLARIGRSLVLYEAGMRTALLADPWALARVVLLRGRATGAWCACGLMRVISLSESRPAPSEHGRRLIYYIYR